MKDEKAHTHTHIHTEDGWKILLSSHRVSKWTIISIKFRLFGILLVWYYWTISHTYRAITNRLSAMCKSKWIWSGLSDSVQIKQLNFLKLWWSVQWLQSGLMDIIINAFCVARVNNIKHRSLKLTWCDGRNNWNEIGLPWLLCLSSQSKQQIIENNIGADQIVSNCCQQQ